MSKSKLIIDNLAKLIEEGLITTKDISNEVKNSLDFKKNEILNKLNFVTKDEFEVQKARLDKIQKELEFLKKNKNKNKNKKKSKKVKRS